MSSPGDSRAERIGVDALRAALSAVRQAASSGRGRREGIVMEKKVSLVWLVAVALAGCGGHGGHGGHGALGAASTASSASGAVSVPIGSLREPRSCAAISLVGTGSVLVAGGLTI